MRFCASGYLACGSFISGKFYGESSRVQFQNANFQRRIKQIPEKKTTEHKSNSAKIIWALVEKVHLLQHFRLHDDLSSLK